MPAVACSPMPASAREAAEQLLSIEAYEKCLLEPDEPLELRESLPPRLTEVQRVAIDALRELLDKEIHSWSEAVQREAKGHLDCFTLLRFIEARPAGISAALAMLRDTMKWRASDNRAVNRVFVKYHVQAQSDPFVDAARRHFYAGFIGFDKNNEPIFGERLGKVDLPGLAREGEPLLQCLLDAYVANTEAAFRMVRAASCASGQYVKATFVVDASGFNMSLLRHVSLIKMFAGIGPPYYPEVTRRVLIVNAPRFASAAWAIISPMLPKATREKVSVHSSATTPPVLSERFEASELPEYLGGTKPHGDCHVSQAEKILVSLSEVLKKSLPQVLPESHR